MVLAISGLFLPAMFAAAQPDHWVVEEVSLLVAGVLLVTYVAYLVFSLFGGAEPAADAGRHRRCAAPPKVITSATWSVRALIVLAAATVPRSSSASCWSAPSSRSPHQLGWSEFFVGIIIVPLIGNAAEHFSAVVFAGKNRVDLTMAIAAGSSSQIALFVAPVLVFLSLLLGNPMDLVFDRMELLVLGLTTAIFAFVALDGRSNWLEGAQLLALYLIIAGGVLLPARHHRRPPPSTDARSMCQEPRSRWPRMRRPVDVDSLVIPSGASLRAQSRDLGLL